MSDKDSLATINLNDVSSLEDLEGKSIEIVLPYDESLATAIHQNLASLTAENVSYTILSRSLDARGAPKGRKPQYRYRLKFNKTLEIKNSHEKPSEKRNLGLLNLESNTRPIIIGSGPAGLFCAHWFLEHGIQPILFERGARSTERMKDIAKFWRYGQLNANSNVCYGEGGAGLFSDGKLNTRIKSPLIREVMQTLVSLGAKEEILYEKDPHLGSNRIRSLIGKMTDHLIDRGAEVYFNCPVQTIEFQNSENESGQKAVVTTPQGVFETKNLVLATGHSAREIYNQLAEGKVKIEARDTAVGVRIEHPREFIDKSQLGGFAGDPLIGAARYRLSFHNPETERGTYSFCMCPGGSVLSTGTENETLVSNGMSNEARNSPWSNSAFVVSAKAGIDFPNSPDGLSGLKFLEDIEKAAFQVSKTKASGKELPAQPMTDFMNGTTTHNAELFKTSTPSKVFYQDLHEILPSFVVEHLKNAFNQFNRQIPGFIHPKALLIAPETRTSAPLKIIRDNKTFRSISHSSLIPVGEGAGYAGGITSAAVDGIKAAQAIITSLN